MLGAILGASDISAAPVAILIALGVIVGIGGHIAGSRRTVVAGIAILFVASAMMLVGGYLAFQDDPGDPRPCTSPESC